MKSNTKKQLFTEEVEREYDRFISERRKREAKRRPIAMKLTRHGPDRSGY